MNKILNVLELPLLPAPEQVLLLPEYSKTLLDEVDNIFSASFSKEMLSPFFRTQFGIQVMSPVHLW